MPSADSCFHKLLKLPGTLRRPTFALYIRLLFDSSRLPFVIIRNDKLAGYSFVHIADLPALERLALPLSKYIPAYFSDHEVVALRKHVVSIANRAQQLDPDLTIASPSCKTLNGEVSTCLGYTLKTHKDQGDIGPRSLHLARQPLCHGLSAWVVWNLEPPLRALPHMVWDSFEFRRAIHHIRAPEGSRIVAADLKDFFLSGTAAQLADDATLGLPQDRRQLVREAILLLLNNQYVQSKTATHYHRCICGAGMGLKHSSHIANLAFNNAVERRLFRDKPLATSGVLSHTRYHDDVLMLMESRQSMLDFMAAMQQHSQYFRILVREVSSHALQHLDLVVALSDGRVEITPSLAKIPIPLSPMSAHPPHIHCGWPTAVYHRVAALSDHAPEALAKLRSNYRAAGADAYTMQQLRPSRPAPRHPTVELELLPLTLRYHPAFRRPVLRAIRQLPPPPTMLYRLVASWSNALPSLATHINHHNHESCDNDHRVGSSARAG